MSFIDEQVSTGFVDTEPTEPVSYDTQNPDPLKAQAAMLALTERDVQAATESYKNIMNGVAPPITNLLEKTQAAATASLNEMSAALPTVLSDPNITFEAKQALIGQVQRGELKAPDVSERLAAEMAKKEANVDDYSEQVRTKTFEQLTIEAQGQWVERQKVVNAANVVKDGTLKKIGDFLGIFAPMGEAYQMTGVQKFMNKTRPEEFNGSLIYSTILPGSSFAEFHKKFHQLPYDEQTAVMRELSDIIKSSSSMLTSDNQMRASSFLSDLNDPEYSNFEKYSANVFNILDAVGLGQLIRTVPSLVKGAAGAAKGFAGRGAGTQFIDDVQENVAAAAERNAVPGVEPSDLAQVTSTPQRQANAVKIETLEQQQARLLEENLVPLEKGEVSRLEAIRAQLVEKQQTEAIGKNRQRAIVDQIREAQQGYDAQIRRIDEALDQNRIAMQNIEQLTSIEKELKTLRKGTGVEDIPLNPVHEAIQRAYMQSTVFTHNPRTAGNIAMNTNPQEARNIFVATAVAESDEVAQALYGVSKNEALVKGVAPQVTDASGRVKFVTPDIERGLRNIVINTDNKVVLDPLSGIQFTEAERASAKANIVNDYETAVGVKLHPAMTSISAEEDGSKVVIKAVYTAGDTGWLKPEDAVEQTKFALRSRGVSDDDITILAREGDEFVPVNLDDVRGRDGEYVVSINKDEYITPSDVDNWDSLDVRLNFFDRLFGHGTNRFGSLQSHTLPISTMLHPKLVSPAMIADDKVSVLADSLLKQLDKFSTSYMSLSKERKEKAMQYIEEANAKELPFDVADLAARGFTPDEAQMFREWRTFWDMDWNLENIDVIRSLNSQGYQWLESGNMKAAVKAKGKNYNIKEVYDPMADVIRPIDSQEIDQIYAMGGTVGEFRRPIDINGTMVQDVLVRNTSGEYLRKLGMNDRILDKREGYYQVHHKAVRYVEETFKDNRGKLHTHVIATTGSTKDADKAVELLTTRYPDRKFNHRGEERGIERGSAEYWDLHSAGGRIAQRHRGKLIEANTAQAVIGAQNFVENPVEAGLKAAASISGRTAMRPMLETAKERFMAQYGHMVPAVEGVKSFPTSLDQILQKGEFTKKELADARTTWNYINYLETGYINTIDNVYKNAMRLLADITGSHGFEKAERIFKEAGETSISGLHKSAIFSSMLATNPFRQWIVQSNQSIRAVAYNPVGFASGTVFKYFYAPFGDSFKIPLTKEQKAFKEFMEETGMFQAISKNNLIRGTLLEASEKSTKIGTALNKVPQTTRRIGFDLGEKINLTAHGAAVYDEFIRAGKDVTKASVKAEMHDRIRAITLDMNFAGDMPYNQNALSFLMTYMQVPHKAISALGSRRIPAHIRNRMAAYDLMMWGLPTEAISKALDIEGFSPENPEVRRLVEDGLQSWYLNKMWEYIDPENPSGVDYSSLNPFGMENWVKMVQAMWFDGGISKMVDSSVGSKVLGFGMDSRMGRALAMTGEFFKDFYDKPENPTTVLDVLDSWARMSSGWSNFQKARMQWALGVSKDKYGNVIDADVTKIEAINQFFGFGSEDVRDYYNFIQKVPKDNKAIDDMVKDDVNKFIELANMKENGMMDVGQQLKLHSRLMASTPSMLSTPKQRNEYIQKVSERLVQTPDSNMWKIVVRSLGYPDNEQFIDNVRRSPIAEDEKERIIRIFTDTREVTKEINKE